MKSRLCKSIQQILLAGSTAVFAAGTLAAVGQQNPPPGPGQIPDYFGVVPNYANSPQPILATVTITDPDGTGTGAIAAATTYDYALDKQTDKIMNVQVLGNGGSGYSPNTTVIINGGPNVTIPAVVTPTISSGVIIGFTIVNAGAGYNTPIAGSGIRKFVDSLPLPNQANNLGQSMPVAVPDTTTFPGSDYYEIEAVEHTEKLHSDLPATHLRGYRQINVDTAAHPELANTQYLGPTIIAQKDRTVRVKLVNHLSKSGDGSLMEGKLPIPVDTTYMGADGPTDTDNRTALHLHGGNTPWISDGTPRQWVKPVGEKGNNRGESARNVPDMWFYADGTLVPNSDTCTQGTTTCTTPDATNDPGAGALTFFYTNEQSARLMFYHDHAEGTTRLNVYAGMAGSYILQDPTEQAMVYGGTAHDAALTMGYSATEAATFDNVTTFEPGTLPPMTDTIPLVIQEKTFVPNNTEPVLNFYGPFRSALNSQDPTWRWGTTGYDANGAISPGLNGNGDLWVPHVFMPNQNPGDVSGANSVGRWDYGAWFWPPFVNLQNGPIANPYYDPSCNTTTSYCEGPEIPGVPNGSLKDVLSNGINGGVADATKGGAITESPSGTPEAFNDTPLVNGTAYPYINVDPKQYRLRILSVGNDRMLNLSMVVAASKNTDTTADANAGATGVATMCDGSSLTAAQSVVATATANVTAAQAALDAAQTALEVAQAALNANTGTQEEVDAKTTIRDNAQIALDSAKAASISAQSNLSATAASIESSRGDCTEVKMVPFTSAQDKTKPFPGHWYTKQKGGVTFDGRPSGVFDPATRGPEMVQIGTEGGFLAAPVEIANQPVNYEYNPKNILIGNIKEHALLLGPAERADVLVDFSNFAGSTLILYNDAGAPVPAWDLRLDYYTGNFDNTDTGGAFSVIPGYGPNSRTLMQIRVSSNGGSSSHPVDDKGSIDLTSLTSAVQGAFKASQEPIIVPQSVYNGVYGLSFPDALGVDLSRIGDHSLTYQPYDPATNSVLPAVKLELEPKTIIEDWTMNWGRMNALLGTEVPHTTAINQTSIPQAFVDPPTDLVKITPNDNMVPISGTLPDGTQIWKITHNGVDSHAIHFHLFHVQIVNRVGWDGAVYPPDANELGWKDTVRMNPLSDTIVALRPMTMTALPFKVPNSHRLLDPALAANAPSIDFFNFSPLDGNASDVTNQEVNYGWEYLWHCHILGHEENDMMRTIAVAQPPEKPLALTLLTTNEGAVVDGVQLDWKDNSMVSNWVTIQRSLNNFQTVDKEFSVLFKDVYKSNVTGGVVVSPAPKECPDQAGCIMQYVDAAGPENASVSYRIVANNTVGAGNGKLDAPRNPNGTYSAALPIELSSLTPGFRDYANVTANSDEAKASRVIQPIASATSSLAFGSQTLNTTSATKVVTVSNAANATGDLVVSGVVKSGTYAGDFAIAANTCAGKSLLPGSGCAIIMTFTPTAVAGTNESAMLAIATNDPSHASLPVSLTGTSIAAAVQPVPPAAPVGVAIERTSATAATLSWIDASNNETSFQAQRSIDGGITWLSEGNVIQRIGNTVGRVGDTLTRNNIVVANATKALYRVLAINATGNSPSAASSLDNTVAPARALQARLVATRRNGNSDRVVISWTDVANNNASYVIQYRTANIGWTTLQSTAGNATSFTWNNAARNTSYQFRVQAVNSVSVVNSNVRSVTTP